VPFSATVGTSQGILLANGKRACVLDEQFVLAVFLWHIATTLARSYIHTVLYMFRPVCLSRLHVVNSRLFIMQFLRLLTLNRAYVI